MRRFLLAIAVVVGCGGGAAPPPAAVVAPANEAPPDDAVVKPPGYVEMQAREIVDAGEGAALLLFEPVSEKVLPIFIGGTEGLSIQLRMSGEHFQRPLTHDLLDAVVKELGGEIVKVQVDAIRGNTFHGSVHIRRDGRIRALDARPSDAIALAIGNRVPIYVAQRVLDESGMTIEELMRQAGGAPAPGGP